MTSHDLPWPAMTSRGQESSEYWLVFSNATAVNLNQAIKKQQGLSQKALMMINEIFNSIKFFSQKRNLNTKPFLFLF